MSPLNDVLQQLTLSGSQRARFLRVTTSLGVDALLAESVDGWEAIDCGGFRFRMTALAGSPSLALDALVGAPVLIEWLEREDGDAMRPVHGHVVAAELVGYNGGLARYRLEVAPWLALLRQRVDHYNYQNASVIDISEQIFAYYGEGVVAPAWRWAVSDPSRYRRHSLVTQAGESDFDFLQRLWAEEGLFYWFEHVGDAGASNFGKHTLVLADSNQQFMPEQPDMIGFHQVSDGDSVGNIRHFMTARRWRIGRVSRASWDYRTVSTQTAAAQADGAAVAGEDRDVAGPYAFQNAALADRRARQQLDAQRVAVQRCEGSGTCLSLRPGLRFAMHGHSTLKTSDAFVCLGVHHAVRANLDADVHAAIERSLGKIPAISDFHEDAGDDRGDGVHALHVALGGTHEAGSPTGIDAVYANRFLALPATQTYRPLIRSGHGARSHAIGSVQGAQSAIVVGQGDPLHTDRDHRVRIQLHAQRGQNAASLESHPHIANAPANRGAGTWTRVMTPVGGDNWGGMSPPRVGQEVWTEWLEGQAERPVVVGSLYNGQGHVDAQHNAQAGGPASSTGNAAAWFAGNGHAAALTGIKTQDMTQSQQGNGGYRQLLLDDTAGEASARLYTTDHGSGLTLGHLKQIEDNLRQANRGYGMELTTNAAAALRAGAGVLISAAPGASQMDASAVAQVLTQNRQLLDGLAGAAREQGAEPVAKASANVGAASSPSATGGEASAGPAAVAGMKETEAALGAKRSIGEGAAVADGGVAAWTRPHVVAHGEDGLVATTPKSQVWVSGTVTVLSAGQDLQWTAKGRAAIASAHGIALYTKGTVAAGRPVSGQGIALHAATGAVNLHAQNAGSLRAAAQQAVTMSSTQAGATLQAPKRVLLNAARAYLKMEGGNIEIGAPGSVEFKSARRELTGPQGASGQVSIAQSSAKDCQLRLASAAMSHDSVVMLPAA